MTLTFDLKNFGSRCGEFFDLALPKGAKIKTLSRIIGQAPASAERLTRGEAPTTAQVLSLTRHFGRGFLEHVFGDLIAEGAASTEEAQISRLLAAVREECNAKTVRSAVAAADPGAGRAAELEPGASGRAALGGATASRLISERLPLERIRFFQPLVQQLEHFHSRLGEMEPGEVIAWARADANGRTGVVTHRAGDVHRFGYRSRSATLVAPSEQILGKPVSEGSPESYGALITRTCLEAEEASAPILARLKGQLRRVDGVLINTDVAVLRTVFRSRRREASIVSTFVPIAA